MVIFHSYVKLPEGIFNDLPLVTSAPCSRTTLPSYPSPHSTEALHFPLRLALAEDDPGLFSSTRPGFFGLGRWKLVRAFPGT